MSPHPHVDPAPARRARPLPGLWTHRTKDGIRSGPLETRSHGDAPSPSTAPGDELTRSPRQHPLQVLWVLTRTDFRARYRGQSLGILWSLLNPLVMMGIISVIFTQLFKQAEKHFPIFLLIGLLCWQWFTASLTAATGVFINNAEIVKRTVFARQLLPAAITLSYGINFCIEAMVLLAFVPLFPDAFRLSWALLLVPIFLLLQLLLIVGLALMTSVLNVIYRDVQYLVSTALLILYWLTPVFYPLDVIPFPYRTFLQANPMAGVLTSLRRAIMHGELPTPLGWAGMIIPTAVVVLVGWRVFRHYEHMVLDYV